MIWWRNSIAASCSKRKRSRMELLASISNPTRNGRSVSAEKFMICLGGLLLSRNLNWFSFRSLMNLLCLSLTVKITFTSSERLWNVCTGRSSEAEDADPGVTAFAVGEGACPVAGDCAVCAKAAQETKMTANNNATTFFRYISGVLSHIIVCDKQSSIPDSPEKIT